MGSQRSPGPGPTWLAKEQAACMRMVQEHRTQARQGREVRTSRNLSLELTDAHSRAKLSPTDRTMRIPNPSPEPPTHAFWYPGDGKVILIKATQWGFSCGKWLDPFSFLPPPLSLLLSTHMQLSLPSFKQTTPSMIKYSPCLSK